MPAEAVGSWAAPSQLQGGPRDGRHRFRSVHASGLRSGRERGSRRRLGVGEAAAQTQTRKAGGHGVQGAALSPSRWRTQRKGQAGTRASWAELSRITGGAAPGCGGACGSLEQGVQAASFPGSGDRFAILGTEGPLRGREQVTAASDFQIPRQRCPPALVRDTRVAIDAQGSCLCASFVFSQGRALPGSAARGTRVLADLSLITLESVIRFAGHCPTERAPPEEERFVRKSRILNIEFFPASSEERNITKPL